MSRVRRGALLLVVLWVAVVGGGAGPLVGKLSQVQQNDQSAFLPQGAESTRQARAQTAFLPTRTLPAVVVYERRTGLTAQDRARAGADVAALRALPGVVPPVVGPVPSRDGQAMTVVAGLDTTRQDTLIPAVKDLRRMLARPGLPAGLTVQVTGVAGLSADLFGVFGSLDTTLLGVTALVVVVILLLVYRSPVLWALPLLAAGMAYSLAGGLVYLLARGGVLTLNGQSQGILTVLVFGAGTDYALLLIARYREELHTHERTQDAMRAALRGAVPPVLASGATVVLGLLCLLASGLSSNRGLGPVSAVGIAAAVLTMTVLLPALLLLAGRGVFWPRVPRADHVASTGTGAWGRVAHVVDRRRGLVATGTAVALLLLCGGLGQLRATGIPQSSAITGSAESVRGQRVLQAHFPAGEGSPVAIVVPANGLDRTLAVVRGTQGVVGAAALADPGGRARVVGGRALVQAVLGVPGDGDAASRIVTVLRTRLHAAVPGALVGGFTAVNHDLQQASQHDRLVIFPLVLLVILVVLALLLRSVVAPLLLVATVVLSFAATLGASGLAFRHLLGFPGADSSFPLYAFVFLVALGIDYNIFLMTRVREEALVRGTRTGTLRGLAVTGGVITSAGVVLAATFAVLGVLPLVFLAEIGFAVAFGVLLDTLVVRSLLVPALVLLLGDRVWWPGRVARPDAAQERPAG